jgi:hypothetical protein
MAIVILEPQLLAPYAFFLPSHIQAGRVGNKAVDTFHELKAPEKEHRHPPLAQHGVNCLGLNIHAENAEAKL